MLTETHAHLDFAEFDFDLASVVERAAEKGVKRIITIGTSLESSRRAVEIASQFPQVYAVVGVHPGNAEEAPEDVMTPLREIAAHPKVIAIGETGLDYHRLPGLNAGSGALDALDNSQQDPLATIRNGAIKAAQNAIFSQQLELAAELGLNVVIHERDAWDDTLALVEPFSDRLRCVFHCFVGSADRARLLNQMGHLVSFTGIVTFKNSGEVKATAESVHEDGFMVETDSPYLAPVPFRGKRAEPAHVLLVAEEIAKLRGVPLEIIAAATEKTANNFFRFQR